MNIDELRAAQTRERTTDGLQDLRDGFYREVAEYIAELREERESVAEASDDPFGDERVQSLTDEIETAEQVAEAIYERRMGKIVKQASLSAAGMGANADGLTNEERALYTDLVERIEQNKTRVLDVLAGETDDDGADVTEQAAATTPDPAAVANDREGSRDAPTPPPDEPAADATPEEPAADADLDADASPEPSASSAAAAMGGGDGSLDDETAGGANESDRGDADEDGATSSVARETVRITRDVGEILGVDEREYTLAADDVVTLPSENAEPLLARDAAERLD